MIKNGFIEKDIFFNKPNTLNTFKPNIENFGVILKGKSIDKLSWVAKEFSNCFIVNNFDKEIELIGEYLLGKNIVHFSNRSFRTAPLTLENYNKFGISEIQLYTSNIFWDKRLLYAVYLYQSMGLRTVFLPKYLLHFSRIMFGQEYEKKFPLTGLSAIIYALEIIKPKNLWIIGLDFYQSDYLVRRNWNTPIEVMRNKIARTAPHSAVNKWIKQYSNVNFTIVTYFDGLIPQKNLKIL